MRTKVVSGAFVTSDMGLVAFLKMEGFVPVRVHQNHGICFWTFAENVLERVVSYEAGNVRVEPREYSRQYGLTKRELYSTEQAG